jgi:hypothetical protein
MEYTKPEVISFGQAEQLIEQVGQPKLNAINDGPLTPNPAYDLDE